MSIMSIDITYLNFRFAASFFGGNNSQETVNLRNQASGGPSESKALLCVDSPIFVIFTLSSS